MLLIDKVNLAKSAPTRKQFHRREDLTEKIRMQISISAYLAQEYSQWGIITSLARQHDVSRPFIYDLILKMKDSLSTILRGTLNSLGILHSPLYTFHGETWIFKPGS